MSATTKQYSGHLMNELQQIAELEFAIGRIQADIKCGRRIDINQICTLCGEEFGEHSGYACECPHPYRKELNMPFYIEGQYFSAVPQRCTHVAARNSEDTEGVPCRETCEPGKSMCNEHLVE